MRLTFLIFLVFIAANCFAGNGNSTANFLLSGPGSRARGMGNAYTGVAADITSIYWNPAGLGQLTNREIIFTQNTGFANTKND